MDHNNPPVFARNSTGGAVAFSRGERERHIYLVGKSGSGKSTALFNLAMHDIASGEGVAIIDPHGDLAEAIIDALPPERTNEVCYLNVADPDFPVGFNPLAGIPADRWPLAASGVVSAFKHLWHESWGPRLEYFLFNGVAALLAGPRPTLIDLPRLYTDATFRERIVRRITDPIIGRFWRQEYPSYDRQFQAEAAAPILNKVGQIASTPVLRNILGQASPKYDLGRAMNGPRKPTTLAATRGGGILIANLAKGQIGEQASNLLGSLLISHLQLVAMARSDVPPGERLPFFVHVDEFQNFSTDTFASLLAEARKFGTHFSLANQYVDQLTPSIRSAVLGNAGTLLVFRVSASDAEVLAPEFHPVPAHVLADQWPFRALVRGLGGQELIELSPPAFPSRRRKHTVIAQSRRNFGRNRVLIEKSMV